METEKKRIIIGSKNISAYIPAVVFELSKSDEIELSAVGSNVNKLERLVRLVSDMSCKPILEKSRKIEKFREIDATICILRRKG